MPGIFYICNAGSAKVLPVLLIIAMAFDDFNLDPQHHIYTLALQVFLATIRIPSNYANIKLRSFNHPQIITVFGSDVLYHERADLA